MYTAHRTRAMRNEPTTAQVCAERIIDSCSEWRTFADDR